MLISEIGGEELEIPQDFKDITIKDFQRIRKFFIENCPEKLKKTMFMEESEEKEDFLERVNKIKFNKKDEKQIGLFQRDYIAEVIGISKELSEQLPIESDGDDWSMTDLFYHLTFIMYQPNVEGKECIEVNGNKYYCAKNLIPKLNQEVRQKGLTFIEFRELTAVNGTFKSFEAGGFDYLDLFLSIMYRPKIKSGWFKKKIEPYSEDKAEERREVFLDVDMETAFGACFFLLTSLSNYKNDISQSFDKMKTLSGRKDLERILGI